MATSATIAKKRYNAKTYDRVFIRVKKGQKERLKEYAESVGMSVNSFVLSAIEEKIERLQGQEDSI